MATTEPRHGTSGLAAAGRDAGPTGEGAAAAAVGREAGATASGVDHEHSDVNVRPIAIFVLALGFTCVASLLLMSALFGFFDRRAAGADPAAPALGIARRDVPPDPRLQTDPVLDLKAFRAQEDAKLHGYAWVDKNAGVVRIPIERAMELIAERGLPPTAASTARPDTATAPPR